MNRKKGHLAVVEEKQPMKHKPKRKVSELDDSAAKRRRTQACRAQRAFRQRKEDTITSLSARIATLDRTIEDLNTCFLSLTDELLTSGWLKHDPQATKAVQRTIKRFISVVRASHVPPQKDDQSVRDYDIFDSTTTQSPPSVVDINAFVRDETIVEPLRTGPQWNTPLPPLDFQNFPDDLLPSPHHNHKLNFTFHLPLLKSLPPPSPGFAQRLHLEAIRAGLRVVCTAEDRSLLFYRIFNRVLDLPTRQILKSMMIDILDHNFNQLLLPPPESDIDTSWAGGPASSPWLHASDVARYFRTIGVDLDQSQGIVSVKVHSGSLVARLLHTRGLDGRRGPVQRCPDVWEQLGPSGHFPSQDRAFRYTTTSQCRKSAFAPDVFANELAPNLQNCGTVHISMDVSRLIYEIILGTRCVDNYPSFNRHDLDSALARAVIEMREMD